MAKKTIPIITHTEILCYAIRGLEAEISKWKSLCKGNEDFFNEATAELREKLDAVKSLYRIETGIDYD